jgi:hypothetical protein
MSDMHELWLAIQAAATAGYMDDLLIACARCLEADADAQQHQGLRAAQMSAAEHCRKAARLSAT